MRIWRKLPGDGAVCSPWFPREPGKVFRFPAISMENRSTSKGVENADGDRDRALERSGEIDLHESMNGNNISEGER